MLEIRRIRQTEAETVTDLWDEAARSVPDGGPLRERGRRNIAAMLVLTANSHRAACFVAADGDAPRGFVVAELIDDGLLPCWFGRVGELYARDDEEAERRLVRAAVEWLTARGAAVIETDVPLDEPRDALWSDLGWARESVRWRVYPRATLAADHGRG
jgi:hypothetical protein